VPRASAFTLIEVMVASLLAAGIAGAVTVSLSRAVSARDRAAARQEAHARAAAAVDRVARDLANLVRTGDLFDARVLLVDGGGGLDRQHDELLLFTRSATPARLPDPARRQNEGDAHEVQYRLQSAPDAGAAGHVLWRRIDPVPDEVPDGGGVASPIVEGIAALSIDAFDGATWRSSWDSDRDGYPHAVRVTALARSDGPRPAEAWLRRTVAIDRTPAPFATASTPAGSGAAR
jgi:type II secretion system protein J